jgi:hypothetical protein
VTVVLHTSSQRAAANDAAYTEVERALFEQGDLTSREIVLTDAEAHELLASGCYRHSTGFPYAGSHFRRSNADGSCLHLVWRDGVPHLHRDRFDPHASPLSLVMHLTNEARSESAATLAMAWSVVRLLARR